MIKNEGKKPFAKRSFGQNFLTDTSVVNKIVSAMQIEANDNVIEIGPGRGDLTVKLLEKKVQITAIELDRDLIPVLTDRFRSSTNFRLINQDILTTVLSDVFDGRSKIVGNLPYNISTPILRRLIEQRQNVTSMVLMFQREVVDRITANPSDKDRGFLSVLCEMYVESERIIDVSPDAFRPSPKVWSSVVRFIPKHYVEIDEKMFLSIISAGFSQRRKTILNNLKGLFPNATEILTTAEVDQKIRPQDLTLSQWTSITKAAANTPII